MKRLAELQKLLADPTRLRVLWLLDRLGEACVCDIEHVLEVSQPTISRHLRYLKDAGLVEDRRENRWSYYRLLPQRENPAKSILHTVIREAWKTQDARALERRLRHWLAAKKRTNPCR